MLIAKKNFLVRLDALLVAAPEAKRKLIEQEIRIIKAGQRAEAESFSHGAKITEGGEFLRWNNFKRRYEGLASPLEKKERAM